jgi:hypothetical protein
LVAIKSFVPTNGRTKAKPVYKSRSDRPTRSGAGRQAIVPKEPIP